MLKIPIHFKEEDKINYPYLKDTKKLIQVEI